MVLCGEESCLRSLREIKKEDGESRVDFIKLLLMGLMYDSTLKQTPASFSVIPRAATTPCSAWFYGLAWFDPASGATWGHLTATAALRPSLACPHELPTVLQP